MNYKNVNGFTTRSLIIFWFVLIVYFFFVVSYVLKFVLKFAIFSLKRIILGDKNVLMVIFNKHVLD